MKLDVKPGKYVLAVSGGVDSMVLLDMLSKLPDIELVIAHFNHGIRDDSDEDEKLVVATAQRHGLPFAVGLGGLGSGASENEARQARYAFLEEVQEDFGAGGIITAHHQDDLIETAFLNILRGTNPRGLIAITDNPKITRPLLKTSKKSILKYAQEHSLRWREDETNQEDVYLRNYLRQHVLPKLKPAAKQQLLKNIDKIVKNHRDKSKIIATISQSMVKDQKIDRQAFAALPVKIGNELIVEMLRELGFRDFNRTTIGRINTLIRTAQTGTQHDVSQTIVLVTDKASAWFRAR